MLSNSRNNGPDQYALSERVKAEADRPALTRLRAQYAVTRDLFSERELRRMAYWKWRVRRGLHAEMDLVQS